MSSVATLQGSDVHGSHDTYHSGHQKLLGDHFMILAENIFGNKCFVVVMFMMCIMAPVNTCTLQCGYATHIFIFFKPLIIY